MRLAILLLLAAPAFAGPITFTFEGTWGHVAPGILPVEIQEGDPVSGSFTFERFSAKMGDIKGEMSFALGSLIFHQQWFGEWEEQGFGVIGAYALTDETACRLPSGEMKQCAVFLFFHERGRGNGLHVTGAHSRDITSDPYLFPVPEPAAIVLLGSALLILGHASRRKRPSPHERLSVLAADARPVRGEFRQPGEGL